MAVKNKDSITIDYTLTNTTDNKVVSTGDTYSVQIGQNIMLPGFESGMIGMVVNETKTINLTAANAWGEHNPNLVAYTPSLLYLTYSGNTSDYLVGARLPKSGGLIVGITGDTATIDMNVPLAGKDLSLEVTIKEIKDITEE